MDIERIRDLRNAYPFKPFNLILTNGRKLPVDKSYYLGFSPTKRFMTHSSVGGGFEVIRPSEIRDVDFKSPSRLRNGSRRRSK
jgi:hypothetical protein